MIRSTLLILLVYQAQLDPPQFNMLTCFNFRASTAVAHCHWKALHVLTTCSPTVLITIPVWQEIPVRQFKINLVLLPMLLVTSTPPCRAVEPYLLAARFVSDQLLHSVHKSTPVY